MTRIRKNTTRTQNKKRNKTKRIRNIRRMRWRILNEWIMIIRKRKKTMNEPWHNHVKQWKTQFENPSKTSNVHTGASKRVPPNRLKDSRAWPEKAGADPRLAAPSTCLEAPVWRHPCKCFMVLHYFSLCFIVCSWSRHCFCVLVYSFLWILA